jgi:MFS family permease
MMGALLPPLAAGFLAEINPSLPFGILGLMALAIAALMVPFLGESLPVAELEKVKGQSLNPFIAVSSSFKTIFGYFRTSIGPLLIISFLIAFPMGISSVALPLLVSGAGLGSSETGLIISSGTFSIVLVNIFLMEWLIKKIGLWGNLLTGMFAAVVFYIALPFCGTFWSLFLVHLVLAITTSSMRSALITLVAKNATTGDQSVAQAANNQWSAIGNIFGPALGSYLFGATGGIVTYIVAAFLFLGGGGYAWFARKKSHLR